MKTEQIVILVVTEDGHVQEFIKKKHEYLPMLVEVIDEFIMQWEREENEKNISSNNISVAQYL